MLWAAEVPSSRPSDDLFRVPSAPQASVAALLAPGSSVALGNGRREGLEGFPPEFSRSVVLIVYFSGLDGREGETL